MIKFIVIAIFLLINPAVVAAQVSANDTLSAAMDGDVQAQFDVAVLYDEGEGFSQDFVQAATWYRKAADQGHIEAQYHLAVLYDEGEGVPMDIEQAGLWYTNAANQGHPGSQVVLGFKHFFGMGTPQNYVQAYKWFSLFFTNPNNTDFTESERLTALAKMLSTVEPEMTPAEITLAKKLVKEFSPVIQLQ